MRKWYGAPDLLPKDGSTEEEEVEFSGNLIYQFMGVSGFLRLNFLQCLGKKFGVNFLLNAEEEEVRDAVLVTDGDGEIGQVCFTIHH